MSRLLHKLRPAVRSQAARWLALAVFLAMQAFGGAQDKTQEPRAGIDKGGKGVFKPVSTSLPPDRESYDGCFRQVEEGLTVGGA